MQFSRRRFVGTLLATTTLCSVASARAARGAEPRPNIITIILDDVGYSDLGCFGAEIRTPAIDSLATGGLRYVHFDTKAVRSEEHTSELQSLMRISYAVFCLKKKKYSTHYISHTH